MRHAREMQVYEVHAHEMHACEVHAYKMQVTPIRYTLMRRMAVRYLSILISLSTLLSHLYAEFSKLLCIHSPPCRPLLFMLCLTLGAWDHVRYPRLCNAVTGSTISGAGAGSGVDDSGGELSSRS